MATLAANALTIADVLKTIDPKGDAAMIAEVLNQTNAILDDIPWVEGNLIGGNRTSVRTSLPGVTARIANQGNAATKSTSAQIDDAAACFETKSEMDSLVAETGGMGMVAKNRANEAMAHIEALGEKLSETLFYGSASVPEEFVGFANRYNTLSLTSTIINNMIDAGGTGTDNSSIWLVNWGEGKVKGIYPRGTMGGLQRYDEGKVSIVDATGIAGATFLGYREYFTWRCGLAVEDWRNVVRIANVDISNLVAKTSAADLFDLMISAIETIPNIESGRPVFYMNRTVRKMLAIQARDDVQTGGQLTYMDVAGRRVLEFQGIPVRLVDKLTVTEATVV